MRPWGGESNAQQYVYRTYSANACLQSDCGRQPSLVENRESLKKACEPSYQLEGYTLGS